MKKIITICLLIGSMSVFSRENIDCYRTGNISNYKYLTKITLEPTNEAMIYSGEVTVDRYGFWDSGPKLVYSGIVDAKVNYQRQTLELEFGNQTPSTSKYLLHSFHGVQSGFGRDYTVGAFGTLEAAYGNTSITCNVPSNLMQTE